MRLQCLIILFSLAFFTESNALADEAKPTIKIEVEVTVYEDGRVKVKQNPLAQKFGGAETILKELGSGGTDKNACCSDKGDKCSDENGSKCSDKGSCCSDKGSCCSDKGSCCSDKDSCCSDKGSCCSDKGSSDSETVECCSDADTETCCASKEAKGLAENNTTSVEDLKTKNALMTKKSPSEKKTPKAIAKQIAKSIMSLDANNDGRLNADEVQPRLKTPFGDIDTNGDGYLDRGEVLRQIKQRMQVKT